MIYTEGPWNLRNPRYPGEAGSGFKVLDAPLHNCFATVVYNMSGWYVDQPNDSLKQRNTASLIQAAPEMYEALKEVVQIVDHIYGEHSEIGQQVHAAINKAEEYNNSVV